jgi:hypothetical protein
MDHGTLGLVVTIVLVASAFGTAMVAGCPSPSRPSW